MPLFNGATMEVFIHHRDEVDESNPVPHGNWLMRDNPLQSLLSSYELKKLLTRHDIGSEFDSKVKQWSCIHKATGR